MGNYHSNLYRKSQDISLEVFPLSSPSQLASVSVNPDKIWTINDTETVNKQTATTITNFQESQPVNTSSHNLFNFGGGTEVVTVPLTEQASFNITMLAVSQYDSIDEIITFESFLRRLKIAKHDREILFFKKNTFLGVTPADSYCYNVTAFNGVITSLSETVKNKGLTTIDMQINSILSIIKDIQKTTSPLTDG